MDDAAAVGVGGGGEDLRGVRHALRGGEAPLHAVRQRARTERIRDHEAAVHELGVLDREHVRMIERGDEPHLAPEVGEERGVDQVRVGDLEGDRHALDGVLGAVHLREAALRDAPLDPVLAEELARPERGPRPDRYDLRQVSPLQPSHAPLLGYRIRRAMPGHRPSP